MLVVQSSARAVLRTGAIKQIRAFGHISATLAFALVAACSSKSDGTPTGLTPAISVALGTPSTVASPGVPGTVPVTLVRSGGYTAT